MKILYFITGLKKGGAENQLYNLLSDLSKNKNFELKVITLFDGPHRLKIEKLGIEVEVFKGNVGVFNIVNMISFFKNSVKKFKPNIVHSFLFHTNIISKISLFFMKKDFKLICSYRSVIKKLPLIKYLEYINMGKVDLMISNSKTADKDLEIYKKYKVKRKVIYNSFDVKKINLKKVNNLKKEFGNKKIVLTVANFRKEKDYVTNILCCRELAKKRNDFKFLYVGSNGQELKFVKKLVKKYGLDYFVTILGLREDVLELLKISDVFFLPTLFESQSNSVMEAIYMKKPIVSTKIPANFELVKKGFLCELRDYKDMSEKISLVLDGKYDKTWVDVNYKFLIKECSKKNIFNKYRKAYNELIK